MALIEGPVNECSFPISEMTTVPTNVGLDRLPKESRVLIVLFGRIGDVIFTLPSILALKKVRPDLLIDWLVEDRCADLLNGLTALRKVILFRRADYSERVRKRQYGLAMKGVFDLVREVRRERYGAVLDFQGLLKSGVATFLAKGSIKLGSPSTYGTMKEGAGLFSRQVPLDRNDRHLVERHLLVVQELLGIPLSPEPIRLGFTEKEQEHVRTFCGGDPFVILHPFASWPTRNWISTSWADVARGLSKRGFKVAIAGVGGPAQVHVKNEMDAEVPGGLIDLLGKLSLRELALAMARAEAFLAVDSGPMHLASAMGTRVIALFGPTDPSRLGPFGPSLSDEGGFVMGRTGKVVTAGLPCQPCMLRRCPIGVPCQERLTPEMVLSSFDELMANQKKSGQAFDLLRIER